MYARFIPVLVRSPKPVVTSNTFSNPCLFRCACRPENRLDCTGRYVHTRSTVFERHGFENRTCMHAWTRLFYTRKRFRKFPIDFRRLTCGPTFAALVRLLHEIHYLYSESAETYSHRLRSPRMIRRFRRRAPLGSGRRREKTSIRIDRDRDKS